MEGIELHQTRDVFGWFVERIREVREEREKWDVPLEEVPAATLYLAGLLSQMLWSPWLALLDRHGERLEFELALRTNGTDSPRRRMELYRAAADRYLLHLGLWNGLQGRQRGRFHQITEADLAQRASDYYGYAADLAGNLAPASPHKARVYRELSKNFGVYLGILLSLRGEVLHLHPALTPGEEFHLSGGALAA